MFVPCLLLVSFAKFLALLAHVHGKCDKVIHFCPTSDRYVMVGSSCYGLMSAVIGVDPSNVCQQNLYNDLGILNPLYERISHDLLRSRVHLAWIAKKEHQWVLTQLTHKNFEAFSLKKSSRKVSMGLSCKKHCKESKFWTYAMTQTQEENMEEPQKCSQFRYCDWSRNATETMWKTNRPIPNFDIQFAELFDNEDSSSVKSFENLYEVRPATSRGTYIMCQLDYISTYKNQTRRPNHSYMLGKADKDFHIQSNRNLKVVGSDSHWVDVSWTASECFKEKWFHGFFFTVIEDGSMHNNSTAVPLSACSGQVCKYRVTTSPCQKYLFSVAGNLNGQTMVAATLFYTSEEGVPSPPNSPRVLTVTGSIVTVEWKAPPPNGKCMIEIEILDSSNNTVGRTDYTDYNHFYLITTQKYCSNFLYYLRSVTGSLYSVPSGPVKGETGPTAPKKLRTTLLESTRVRLDWEKVTDSCATNVYRVECGDFIKTNMRNISILLKNLAPYTRYACKISAIAVTKGTGDSASITFITKESISMPPNNISIVNVTARTFGVSWTKPSVTNGKITKYQIEIKCLPLNLPGCTENPKCTNRVIHTASQASSHRASYAVSGRRYTIEVLAINSAGPSRKTGGLTFTTKPAQPSAPTNVRLYPAVHFKPGDLRPKLTLNISMNPSCPYPGPHKYDMILLTNTSGQRTYIGSLLSEKELFNLYGGRRNISYHFLDNRWIPGRRYSVKIKARLRIGNQDNLQGESNWINFTYTVPPPGPVTNFTIDCTKAGKILVRWLRPVSNPFGLTGFGVKSVASTNTADLFNTSHICDLRNCCSPQNECDICNRVGCYVTPNRRPCSCETILEQIYPDTEYTITVNSRTKYHLVHSDSATRTCTTATFKPRIKVAHVQCLSPSSLVFTWNLPEPTYIRVRNFTFHIVGERPGYPRHFLPSDTWDCHGKELCGGHCVKKLCNNKIENLRPEHGYTIQLSAKTDFGDTPIYEMRCTTPAGIPSRINGSEQLQPRANNLSVSDPSSQCKITINKKFFDETGGKLRNVGVIVTSSRSPYHPKRGLNKERPDYATWKRYHSKSSAETGAYQASPKYFYPFKDTMPGIVTKAYFTVGEERDCIHKDEDEFCNGPLKPNTTYQFWLWLANSRGFVETDPVNCTTEIRKHKFSINIVHTNQTRANEKKDSQSSSYIATAALVATLLLLALMAVFVVLVRRKMNRSDRTKYCRPTSPDGATGE